MAVSRPHQRLLNVVNAKIVVFLSLFVSVLLTVPQFVIVDMLKVQLPDYSFNICNPEPTGLLQKIISVLKYLLMLCICFTVFILYYKLYRIIRNRRRIGAGIGAQHENPNIVRAVDTDDTTAATMVNSISKSPNELGHNVDEINPVQDGSSREQRGYTDNNLRNRTTRMLIVVTSVMFISWIPPAVLGIASTFQWESPQQRMFYISEREKWTTVLFQMFFSINHAANAIVYCAINKHFRQDMWSVLRKLAICIRCKKI
ncbi:uncharacterized protein [Amphiura filiformis]|uniref:uncharacterized protein n=1 Tax=Amphiura filiformis TaxID=82378 RepID=UPI003B21885A